MSLSLKKYVVWILDQIFSTTYGRRKRKTENKHTAAGRRCGFGLARGKTSEWGKKLLICKVWIFSFHLHQESSKKYLKWPSIGCRESRHNVPHTLPLWFCLEIDNRVGFLWKFKLMYFRCHRIFSFYSLWVNLIESAIFSNFTIEHLWPPSKVHFLRALLGTKFSWMFVMSVWAC